MTSNPRAAEGRPLPHLHQSCRAQFELMGSYMSNQPFPAALWEAKGFSDHCRLRMCCLPQQQSSCPWTYPRCQCQPPPPLSLQNLCPKSWSTLSSPFPPSLRHSAHPQANLSIPVFWWDYSQFRDVCLVGIIFSPTYQKQRGIESTITNVQAPNQLILIS